jgi:hypothetical protein
MIVRIIMTCVLGAGLVVAAAPGAARDGAAQIILAQHEPPQAAIPQRETPDERMRRRFPQPVRVGDLIGLRVLNDKHVTIGFVRHVVRTPQGRIQLIVAHSGVLGWDGRLVAVPIEVVGIMGRQLASLDMKPEEYAAAPTWSGGDAEVILPDEKILIGLTQH